MDQLEKQVARARRRLVLEQLLNRLVWCLFGGLTVAAIAIAVPKLFPVDNLPARWSALWLTSGAAIGTLVALVWTFLANRTPLDAAIEIDRRFGLRERVASSISLSDADRETEAGQAVIKDAARILSRIDVREKFRLPRNRRAWLPLVPAVIAFCLMTFVNNRQAASSSDTASAEAIAARVKLSAEELRKKIAEQRKELEERGLKDAEGIFEEIEKGTKELADDDKVDQSKALVKLNDLRSQLEQRRQQIDGKKAVERQLDNLKNLERGPADKAAAAMKQGNWKRALEEVKQLQQQIGEGQLTAQQKEQLQQQLQQMQEKLAALADAHQQAMKDLQEQIAAAQRQGDLAKAGELQQKLDQLAQQQAQMDRLQQMAAQMAQANRALAQGNQQQAADAMGQLAQQLGQMQQEMEELEMLDAALAQLEMAKNAMGCAQCQGAGCEACQGQGMMGMGMDGPMGQQPGMGMGRGRGIGPRPDEEDATRTRDSRVRQTPGRGAAVFGGFAEGGNVKGVVAEEIKQEMAQLGAEPAEAITMERLPRAHQEHAEQYFRTLREGR